ncbi:Energy-coupling factor transporter ATP-binding protein EcfA 2 [[Clostridium] cellulosi]|uniref:Energy-coupling factor transporter ATP-binding protein EcfA 2 n=1 Tax=[Clostridium] cellulosi TaxID=29343 RepID=A0A078KLF7_9FIRM|nr:Energy-coupling factor transporter ATP-binding protein EcfA 2 [[Clostridium] cellulosi]
MENESINPILETQNLEFTYSYEDGISNKVLNGINLKVPSGQFLAILGRNGSGKSTLAKHFNAVLLPTGGKAYALGIDTSDETRTYDIRQNVGMVFQNPDNQIVATIVEEDVAFALENLGVPPEEIRRRVDEALNAVGMYEYRNHAPHQLSGGQKQRVAIAGIIAMKPKCIVLDEPTAMLDPRGRREVIETIMKLNRDEKITIVLITHFMDEAVRADRVVVIDHGNILLDGAPRSVFSNVAMLKSIGLDVPQAAELLYELNKSGEKLPLDVLTAEECIDALATLLEESHCRKIR